MKGLYLDIIKNQDFGFEDEYKINKKRKMYSDNLKIITEDLSSYVYRVNFSYKTRRGNKRQSHRYLVNNELDIADIKVRFLDYVSNYNKEFPYRELSNVEILDVQYEEIKIPLI